jgi:uncharacterized membrane protein
MLHRSALLAFSCALAVFASACRDSPTDPSRPPEYDVVFLGAPEGAESFTPHGLFAGRVVGTARAGGRAYAVQWAAGGFSRIGPDVPAECESEALAARVAYTVGQVTCSGAGGTPADAYGWITGVGALPRLFTEPYGFVDVNRSAAIVGTVNPPSQFPQATPRAFLAQGTSVTILLPPGAVSSVAAGISDEGIVAVTGYYDCPGQDGDCVPSRAMLWQAGEWTEVSLPDRAEGSAAAAVSAEGHVAGYTLGEAEGLFQYDAPDQHLAALPVVPGTTVEITDANGVGKGQVVGTGFRQSPAPGQQASYGIVWGDGYQYSLSERINDEQPWVVTSALATDDEENVAGTGFNTETGQQGAILLVPAP